MTETVENTIAVTVTDTIGASTKSIFVRVLPYFVIIRIDDEVDNEIWLKKESARELLACLKHLEQKGAI